MPALSFQEEWLRKLLDGTKQQTTRKQTDRIKVGDVCHIYNQQRRRIVDKPMLQMTELGRDVISQKRAIPYDKRTYPPVHNETWIRGLYHAHLLGKVIITEVYDIHPCEMTEDELKAWAVADGFKDFHPTYRICPQDITIGYVEVHEDDGANMWFQRRYGDDWVQRWWTVERWDGWLERYFEPEVFR
jgi:hypothetical protein